MYLKKFIKLAQEGKSLDYELKISFSNEEKYMIEDFCQAEVPESNLYEAWSTIIGAIDEAIYPADKTDFLTNNALNFLIKNKIELASLGHLPLDNKWLLKIYETDNTCIEALQTVAIRYMFDDSFSLQELKEFIEKYQNKFIYIYMLYRIIRDEKFETINIKKCYKICDHIISNFINEPEFVSYSLKYKSFFDILETNNKETALQASQSNDFFQMFALTYNSNFKHITDDSKLLDFKKKCLDDEITFAYNSYIM